MEGSRSSPDSLAGSRQSAHVAQFYEGDAFLAAAVTRFIGDGLAGKQAGVVIATRRHRQDVDRQLLARGVNLAAAREAGRYIALDAAETLERFMSGGRLDEARCTEVIGGVLGRAEQAGGRHGVRVFGEMVALLCADGRHQEAIRLEELWNELRRGTSFSLLCAYPLRAFPSTQGDEFQKACGAHSRVLPAESYAALTDPEERLRKIALLQQRTNALESETAQLQRAERSAKAETRASHRTLHAIIEASPLPIVVIEPDTTVRLWNRAAERVFGWTASEVMGRPLPIVPPEKVTECVWMRDTVLHGTVLSGVETYRTSRDGARVDVVISAAALEDDDAGGQGAMVLLCEEATDRKRAEETKARLAAIVESSDDAIISKTLEGTVTSWNRGAERIFGYTAEEMVGQPLSRLIPADRTAEEASILERMLRGERVDHFETERLRRDGRTIHVSLTVSPIKDTAGGVIGVSTIARDVTDRKRADAELEALLDLAERARSQAEQANSAKDEFLAMLSHELRNPLSAVRNAVVTARLDERRRDAALEIARRQTEQLARLVEDLLDVSRITQGRIVLRKERLYLAEIIDRAVEATRSLIEDRGHTLTVSLPPDGTLLDGDPTRLEQVVVNLISNAARFTERGGHVELLVERHGAEAVLRVRDDGIGIAPDLLPRVFDLFAQADRGLDRAKGGLGIGLTLVHSLVALHGGRVEAHSEGPGRGAEFVVHLPAEPAPGPTADASPPLEDLAHPQYRARVLVVEDNPDAAESLAMLLELLGHHVRVVHDGVTALDVAPAHVPDVMLVDIGLPGLDGYEVARRVRRHPDLRHVGLIALTGYGRDDDRERALKAGFDYHLVKPVDPATLEGLVGRVGKDRAPAGKGRTVH